MVRAYRVLVAEEVGGEQDIEETGEPERVEEETADETVGLWAYGGDVLRMVFGLRLCSVAAIGGACIGHS